MIEKLDTQLLERLEKFHWEFAVKRTGFLQSKAIYVKACINRPLRISPSVSLSFKSMLWLMHDNLYDNDAMESFPQQFKVAFEEKKDWPLEIVENFRKFTIEKDEFVKNIVDVEKLNIADQEKLFKTYYDLLQKIQHHYILARAITNYCESELSKNNPDLLKFSYPYEKLDVDHMSMSLRNLKSKEKEGTLESADVRAHLNRFGWIKTAYNIVEPYTETDLKNELKNVDADSHEISDIPDHFMLNGLRAGIFIRNRIKELAQQIWFAVEPLAISFAKYLKISREDFYTLLYEEVLDILHNKTQIDTKKIEERRNGYVYGFIDEKEILLVSEDFKTIESALIKKPDADVKEIRGQIACKGNVVGIVKVVRGHEDFGKLSEGEILVVSMTTPDYMIIIKKAGAIVTDEGGLSCHAAIVSREFNIPCVMGTKIGTQVLKDGMKIEVDANNGVVKILEQGK